MPWGERGDPFLIEPRNQIRNGFTITPPDGVGGGLIIAPLGDKKQDFGAKDLHGGRGLGPTDLLQGGRFRAGEGTQRVFFTTGHSRLQIKG